MTTFDSSRGQFHETLIGDLPVFGYMAVLEDERRGDAPTSPEEAALIEETLKLKALGSVSVHADILQSTDSHN